MEEFNKLKNDNIDKTLKSLAELERKIQAGKETDKKIEELKKQVAEAKKKEAELIKKNEEKDQELKVKRAETAYEEWLVERLEQELTNLTELPPKYNN